MKDIKCKMSYSTNYNFKVIRNEQIIQEENTHNVILSQAVSKKTYHSPSYTCYAFGTELLVGDGTGTPAESDTALFHQVWEIARDSLTISNIDNEKNSVTARYIFTIPATTSYVGTITECGLNGHFANYRLYTHALVRDAEGNPISINKTDLDKIVITIDLTISIGVSDPDIKMVPIARTPFRYALQYGEYSNFHSFNCAYGNSDATKTDIIGLVQNPQAILQTGCGMSCYDYGLRSVTSSDSMPKVNNITKIVSDNVRQCTGRIAQDAYANGKVGYVKGIVLLGTFVIPLPNANYFPFYPLTGIEVGIAAEGATEMLCPLDHFVKDSEVVYKNGVALTRDIDYTVDSENNHRGLVELTAANDAIVTGGITYNGKRCWDNSDIFRAKNWSGPNQYDNDDINPTFIYAFSSEKPLFFDMQKEVTLNFLRVPTGSNLKYTLHYSEDGITYSQHMTHTFTSATGYILEFAPITAQYFKLEVATATGGATTVYSNKRASSTNNPESFFALGHKTDGMIKFTTPLTEGDVITMDCTMDLPYKTSNNVIDYDFLVSL